MLHEPLSTSSSEALTLGFIGEQLIHGRGELPCYRTYTPTDLGSYRVGDGGRLGDHERETCAHGFDEREAKAFLGRACLTKNIRCVHQVLNVTSLAEKGDATTDPERFCLCFQLTKQLHFGAVGPPPDYPELPRSTNQLTQCVQEEGVALPRLQPGDRQDDGLVTGVKVGPDLVTRTDRRSRQDGDWADPRFEERENGLRRRGGLRARRNHTDREPTGSE
jgi:hypothetical protein